MRITVFGAAGNVGSRVVAEALARGHEVTAVVRDATQFFDVHPDARVRTGDASKVEDVAALGAGQDVVISATRPVPGRERDHVTVAKSLLAGHASTGVRLLLVGGAGSLTVPGSGGTAVVDDPKYVPAAWRDIALACVEQFEVCLAEPDADWTYLSPAAILAPGERTGKYRLGTDELVVDDTGRSAVSMEDLAVALLDEVERPRHRRARFTVGY